MDFDFNFYVFKAGLIMAFFMHLFWERYTLVNVLLWPMTAIACFVGLMVAEGKIYRFYKIYLFCSRRIMNKWTMDVNFRHDRLKKNHPAFKLDNIEYLKALYDLMKPRVMSLLYFYMCSRL